MITREETFNLTPEYPPEQFGTPDEVLFFDIETTGLSADKNQVYMTGVLHQSGDAWKITQWLSDTPESEGDLLDAFFSYLRGFKVLVSFNGDTFDIPFLLKRCRACGKCYNFDDIESVDIYKLARPYRKMLGLENCRQKTIESFLGIDREDIYSGGELINIYIQYLYTRDDSLADLLLLHNADDLRGMPKILSILSYPGFFRAPLHLISEEITEDDSEGGSFLTLRCESDIRVPVPVNIKASPVFCELNGKSANFIIGLIRGTFKHYFPDPENYYYLIYEDMAVHKSVGQYVAREARKQATAKTCYVKQEGLFMPQFDAIWEPVMKTGPNDKMCYVLIDNADFNDAVKWEEFSHRLLEWIDAT